MVSPSQTSERASPAFLSRADIGLTLTSTRTDDRSRRSLLLGVIGVAHDLLRCSCCCSCPALSSASASLNDSAAGFVASSAARGDEAPPAFATEALIVRSPAPRVGVASDGDAFGLGLPAFAGLSLGGVGEAPLAISAAEAERSMVLMASSCTASSCTCLVHRRVISNGQS
jgi:hypothetical protein